jgi:hypothetical protein
MSFLESEVKKAWDAAGGRCQCARTGHWNHTGKCNKELVWANRGKGKGAWDAHTITAGGPGTALNCEILCGECQQQIMRAQTRATFGRP